MGLHLKQLETLLADLPDKVLTVAVQVLGVESVAGRALGMTVVLVEARAHVATGKVMAAVGLLNRLYVTAGDAAEHTAGHRVSQPYVLRELLVEFRGERGQRRGRPTVSLLTGSSLHVVWHILHV